jgi:hypothetical protein
MTKEGEYSIKPNNIEGNLMKAFYFATKNRKLRYGDNRPIVVGETHTVDCKPIPCEQGLHASKRLIDALRYAPGTVLYLVELSGEIVETDDKACATERKYLAEFDLSDVLFKFSCACALINIELIKPYTKDFDLILEFLKNPVKENAYAAYAAYAAAYAAYAAADAARENQNTMFTQMVRDATGWDI